ncbi:MAG: nitrogen fixation protein NifM [Thiotrichales bacterium]
MNRPMRESVEPSPNPREMEVAYLVLKTALNLHKKPPAALTPDERAKIEPMAIRQHDLESRALRSSEARGVAVPEETVRIAFEEIRGRYADDSEFEADLAGNGLSSAGFRAALERELRVDAVLDKVASASAQINEIDVELFYQFHLSQFQRPELRRARHILITINEMLPENTREAARRRIDAIARRLAKDPRRFEEQALKHSECPTAMHGGLLGDVPRGQLYPELDAALYALKPDALSGVIESPLGFHLLRCDVITPGGTLPIDAVRDKIRVNLEQRRVRMCQKAWFARLAREPA